ncbi:hypothetical protein Tco_0806980, partial [Tanacetum coccineum]
MSSRKSEFPTIEKEIKLRFDSVFEDPVVEFKNLRKPFQYRGLKDEIGTYVEEDGDLLLSDEGVVNTFHNLVDEQPLISPNALSGVNTYRTMRVKGCVGRNALHVLVDSG